MGGTNVGQHLREGVVTTPSIPANDKEKEEDLRGGVVQKVEPKEEEGNDNKYPSIPSHVKQPTEQKKASAADSAQDVLTSMRGAVRSHPRFFKAALLVLLIVVLAKWLPRRHSHREGKRDDFYRGEIDRLQRENAKLKRGRAHQAHQESSDSRKHEIEALEAEAERMLRDMDTDGRSFSTDDEALLAKVEEMYGERGRSKSRMNKQLKQKMKNMKKQMKLSPDYIEDNNKARRPSIFSPSSFFSSRSLFSRRSEPSIHSLYSFHSHPSHDSYHSYHSRRSFDSHREFYRRQMRSKRRRFVQAEKSRMVEGNTMANENGNAEKTEKIPQYEKADKQQQNARKQHKHDHKHARKQHKKAFKQQQHKKAHHHPEL
jgi:hypothetical protein